jgi:hypothetical protein
MELSQVMSSGAPTALKQRVQQLIGVLTGFLNAVIAHAPNDLGGWVPNVAAPFDELSTKIQMALPGIVKGACMYTTPEGDQCVQMTQGECDQAGGVFCPNTPCP